MNNNEFTPLFIRYQQKSGLTDTPFNMNTYYKNRELPLQFIRNDKLITLQQRTQEVRNNLKKKKHQALQISKKNYKKVVTRDNKQYKFGLNLEVSDDPYIHENYGTHKQNKQDLKEREKQIQMKQQLQKKFIHNYQDIIKNNLQSKQMNYDIIKQIDSANFQQKYRDVQFAQFFIKSPKQTNHNQKYHNPYEDISDSYQLEQILLKLQFNLVDKDSQYSEISEKMLFISEDYLDFWKRPLNEVSYEISQEQLLKRCENLDLGDPKYTDFLDFATQKISMPIISEFVKLKNKRKRQMQQNNNQENLQQEYQIKKAQYQMLKDLKIKDKNKKIAVKYASKFAQTINQMEEQSFDSYFEQGAKNLLIELKDLNEVRQKIIKGKQLKQTQKTMLVNIGYQIKGLLFKLLNAIMCGEDIPEYAELMYLDDRDLAERKILQLIYLHFDKIKKPEIDGLLKSTLLKVYLEERQKNEKIFQIIGRQSKNQKKGMYTPKKQQNINKTPDKNGLHKSNKSKTGIKQKSPALKKQKSPLKKNTTVKKTVKFN